MTKPEHLDSVGTENKVVILSNAITECMISNGMTLAMLDEAYEVVKGFYRMNAVMRKSMNRMEPEKEVI